MACERGSPGKSGGGSEGRTRSRLNGNEAVRNQRERLKRLFEDLQQQPYGRRVLSWGRDRRSE